MWRCPVCQQQVSGRPGDVLPARNVVYRCHTCRIDLLFDEDYGHFRLAPLQDADPPKPPRTSRRRK